jgi:hypothetical protein
VRPRGQGCDAFLPSSIAAMLSNQKKSGTLYVFTEKACPDFPGYLLPSHQLLDRDADVASNFSQ